MYQFNVYRIGPEIKLGEVDLSFTNASLFMVISSIAIILFFGLGSKRNSLIPNKIQLISELSYTFVSKMISDTAGSNAKPYFSFIFSLFMFILFCNIFWIYKMIYFFSCLLGHRRNRGAGVGAGARRPSGFRPSQPSSAVQQPHGPEGLLTV